MHPLDGPRFKIARAYQQIDSLQHDSELFFNRYIGAAPVGKFNEKTGMYDLLVPEQPDIPLDWSICVGEIAHNLRSALDQLVCQLAIVSELGRDWRFCEEKRTGFPIYICGPRSGKPMKERFTRKRLSYLRKPYRTTIQGFQPYKRRNGQRRSPLWLLHQMNNADKHRVIPVVAGWIMGTSVMPRFGFTGPFTIKVGVPLKANTKIGEVSSLEEEMHMNRRLYSEIKFGEGCDAIKGLPVVGTLARIADQVSKIVKSFSGEFD